VDALARLDRDRADRRERDDRSPPAARHARRKRPHRVEGPAQVQPDDAVELLGRVLQERLADVDAHRVDEHVHDPEALRERRQARLVEDVGLLGRVAATVTLLRGPLHGVLGGTPVPVDAGDPGTVRSETGRHLGPDPPAAQEHGVTTVQAEHVGIRHRCTSGAEYAGASRGRCNAWGSPVRRVVSAGGTVTPRPRRTGAPPPPSPRPGGWTPRRPWRVSGSPAPRRRPSLGAATVPSSAVLSTFLVATVLVMVVAAAGVSALIASSD